MFCCCNAFGAACFFLFVLFGWLVPEKWLEESEDEKKKKAQIKYEMAMINYEMALKNYEYLMEQKKKGLCNDTPLKPTPPKQP